MAQFRTHPSARQTNPSLVSELQSSVLALNWQPLRSILPELAPSASSASRPPRARVHPELAPSACARSPATAAPSSSSPTKESSQGAVDRRNRAPAAAGELSLRRAAAGLLCPRSRRRGRAPPSVAPPRAITALGRAAAGLLCPPRASSSLI